MRTCQKKLRSFWCFEVFCVLLHTVNKLLATYLQFMSHKHLFFASLLVLSSSILSCDSNDKQDDTNNVISKFNSTYNIYEKFQTAEDGSITYEALPWGGLVGNFLKNNMPVDLSEYESITFEFAEPTAVATQVLVSDRIRTWGKRGISTLTCHFDGEDVTAVNEIVLQAGDTGNLVVRHIYLTPNDATWDSTPIWKGKCVFGNWEEGLIIFPEKFASAYEGDKIEFILTTDQDDPDITYWQLKTIYSSTENTLEGNDSELNEWGCAAIGRRSTAYRITLTANDVMNLQEYGLFANGYHATVTQVNLLRRNYAVDGNMGM